MTYRFLFLYLTLGLTLHPAVAGPVRVLFLGHDQEHHHSDAYYPMLAKALGRDAIYFDYVTTVEDALGDAAFLNRFDALLLYANHAGITPEQWRNLRDFVEAEGKGFVPVHCASWCFANEPGFGRLVGARFKSHGTGIFSPRTIRPDHRAIRNVPAFEAWDETYFHEKHNEADRVVLQVRDPLPGDPNSEPEPWTWVRTQGKGRIFYTASGHDERVWEKAEFHELLEAGILWSIGDSRRGEYESFLSNRAPLEYTEADFIPNYENRPEPLPKQKPLSPEESLKYTQAMMGWELKVFATEPQIVNPICLAWDERGRLWVAETIDYPNEVRSEGGDDRIKILEDTDGDGRCDEVKVFADGLNIPTGLTFSNGGVIVAQAPHFLFLEDTDGDDRADVRTVLFSGWGTRDTHAGTSNLRYGFDNWIWGAVGYSAFNGEVGGANHRFGSGIYRFRPDGSELEFVAQFNNNTWGLGFNEEGDVFGSTANRNPSFFCGIPQTLFGKEKKMSAKMIADSASFFPITPNIRQVDAFNQYTAGAGHALATSSRFPESWRGRSAFVCGPTGNLLGRFQLEEEGAGFRAVNAYNFVASADEWFSPVAAEIGPDGNVWIADWYNFIIQHNPTPQPERGGFAGETGEGNAHVNPHRDKQHGRIYRVVPAGRDGWEKRSLGDAPIAGLVAALDDGNLFWRQTAQRLLVERGDDSAVGMLAERVRKGGAGAIHALWVLRGLGKLDEATHQFALLSAESALKRNAIRALGEDGAALRLFFDTAVVADRNPRTRLVAFNKLAAFPRTETISRAATELMRNPENAGDEWLDLALRAAGGTHRVAVSHEFGENLLPNPSFEKLEGDRPEGWRVRNYSGESIHSVAAVAKTGERSLRIQSVTGSDTSWFADVDLKPNTRYRVSAWIKTEAVEGAVGATLNLHRLQREALAPGLKKTNDWTRVEKVFDSGDRTKDSVNLLFGGWGKSKGTAYYDDVALQEMIPVYREEAKVAVVADVERGKKVFHEHQLAGCIRCHMVEGKGGPVGPPLDGIAGRKEESYLRQSLTDPQAVIAEGFPAQVSPMPPMGVILTEQEFEDVMAYLLTLK